jgi:hypothetical protein
MERMPNKVTKYLTQSIVGVLLLGVGSTFLADWFKSLSFLTTLKGVFFWLWNGVIWLLNFEIKVWWLLIGIVVIAGIILFIVSIPKSSIEPEYLQYKQEVFEKWLWKWDWHFNGSRYKVSNLHPCCPVCETPLILQSSGWHSISGYVCPRGHSLEKQTGIVVARQDPYTEDIHKIEVLIIDNVNKGLFPKQM